ncbi:MAG: AMP-binding protein, partial [Gammaproteobacteria bacterium]
MAPLSESYWPATDELPLLETSCASVLRAAAAAWPTRTALIDADLPPGQRRRWTFAALDAAAQALAGALLTHLAPGSHVALWAANSPQWVVAQLGVALAGMVLVTVNPALGRGELAYVLGQSRARALFHGGTYRGVDMAATGAAAAREA